MKNIVLTLLRTGATRTKKYTLEDLSKKYGFLMNIAEQKANGLITANNNDIWKWYNRKARYELIDQVKEVKL